jgi:methionyl-tRNA formyltransferase
MADGGIGTVWNSILLCVATEKGLQAFDAALAFADSIRLHVCTHRETNVSQSFTRPIMELAAENGLPLVRWSEFLRDPLPFIDQREIKAMLCIGWHYLVPESVVEYLDGRVFVAHDSLLPKLRGFAPLPTALLTGEERTGVTFLRVGQGVDDGDILWQQDVPIHDGDTIGDLIQRITPLYRNGTERLLRGELQEMTPQNDADATYSIWRDELDYVIDWNDNAQLIERAVRALGAPYLGARCRWRAKTVVIRKAQVVDDVRFAIRQPGKVWELDDDGCPTVVCGDGMLKVLEATVDGKSILPMHSLRVRLG